MSRQAYSTEWLLNPKRTKPSSQAARDLLQEATSDKVRVLFSNPFRRLQQKAQVFPLEPNIAVRTRMTHSLEVAHLGRSLSQVIAGKKEADGDGYNKNREAIAQFVETACLMHDIGNPPFGHFGEEAIRNWFNSHGEKYFEKSLRASKRRITKKRREFLRTRVLPDFQQFDGNCQGLRIVTTIQWDRDEHGLNLSFPQVASFLKYTRVTAENRRSNFGRKAGYFVSEEDIVKRMRAALQIKHGGRHPLVFVVEAADDIAYCFSDLEDGLEKNLINEDLFRDHLLAEWTEVCRNSRKANKSYLTDILNDVWSKPSTGISTPRFLDFKTRVTSRLVEYAAQVYTKNNSLILDGKCGSALLDGEESESLVLAALKNVSRKYLYTSREAEGIEIVGNTVISGLLDHLAPLLEAPKREMLELTFLEGEPANNLNRRLFNRLASKYRMAYKHAFETRCKGKELEDCLEWFYRAHLITDYISGMTDNFALDSYRFFSGIRLED